MGKEWKVSLSVIGSRVASCASFFCLQFHYFRRHFDNFSANSIELNFYAPSFLYMFQKESMSLKSRVRFEKMSHWHARGIAVDMLYTFLK